MRRLKKTICEADGYEREMLSLLYGAVGVMSLDHRSDVIQEGKLKLQKEEVSATATSLATILMNPMNATMNNTKSPLMGTVYSNSPGNSIEKS